MTKFILKTSVAMVLALGVWQHYVQASDPNPWGTAASTSQDTSTVTPAPQTPMAPATPQNAEAIPNTSVTSVDPSRDGGVGAGVPGSLSEAPLSTPVTSTPSSALAPMPQLAPAPVYQQPTGPKYGNQAQEALGDLNYAEKRLRKKEISGVPAGPTTAAQLETLRSEIVTVRQFIEENFNQGQSLSSDVRVRARKASEKAADLDRNWQK